MERNRKNDLYARDMPSAKAIEEIKHLAAVKKTTVGVIVYREHGFTRVLREHVANRVDLDRGTVEDLLKKFGLSAETA